MDNARQTDYESLAAVRAGSQDAFAALSMQYAPLLQQLARQLQNDWMDPEDLIQEGLLGLLSAANHYHEGDVPFSSFAYVCVRRRMLSALSRTSRQKTDVLSEEDWEQELERQSLHHGGESDPANQLVRRESDEQLDARLRALLSEREYRVLCLYLDGFSYDEMANRLSITSKAVDNALQRVRQKLFRRG